MKTNGVVKGFEVGKYIVLCSCPCRIVLEVDQLTLDNGVVIGIAAAGHALPDAVDFQAFPVGPGGHTGRPGRCEKSDLWRVYGGDTPYPELPASAGYRSCRRRHNRRSCVCTDL